MVSQAWRDLRMKMPHAWIMTSQVNLEPRLWLVVIYSVSRASPTVNGLNRPRMQSEWVRPEWRPVQLAQSVDVVYIPTCECLNYCISKRETFGWSDSNRKVRKLNLSLANVDLGVKSSNVCLSDFTIKLTRNFSIE